MPDRPPRQLPNPPDEGGTDLGSQVDMGWADPPPEPSPSEVPDPAPEP